MRGHPVNSGPRMLGRGRIGLAIRGLAVLGVVAWALRPLDHTTVAAPSIDVASSPGNHHGPLSLDLAAFRTPLWVAPPAPPPPAAAAPAPPPLKLQLIAILRDKGEYRAAVYDPETDRLTVVGPGDTIAGRKVERVGGSEVALRDGVLSRTLALRTDEGRP